MVTMKDVAKLAGVSHGTVSNVVNGVKNVSVDKIKKVEAAMAQLGYKPNLAARNLKMEFTNQIDLVLPEIVSAEYTQMFEVIRKCAVTADYTLNLKVTGGVPAEEKRILNESLMNNVDGVILVTCQPSNKEFFHDMQKKGLRMVFCIADLTDGNCNFVGFDIVEAIDNVLRSYKSQGKRIAMLTGDSESFYHDQLISTYCKSLIQENPAANDRYMEIIQVGEEFAAKGAARLFMLNPPPDVVIASSENIAAQIHRMKYLLDGDKPRNLKVVSLSSRKKGEQDDDNIALPYADVCKTAFDMLMNQITGKQTSESRRILIPPVQDEYRDKELRQGRPGRKLRVLLNESPSSEAIRSLIPNFVRRTGIETEIVTRTIHEIYDSVKADRENREYDVYSMDVPWMSEIVESGMLENLDTFVEENRGTFMQYTQDIRKAFSVVNGSVYAMPYVFTVQLLYYRKDLFEKIKNQRLYYEWYKEELKVPETWEDFNKVARLFTREYNGDSETKYGITLGGTAFNGSVCEYLPRLWSLGGDLFENQGSEQWYETMQAALENYVEGFRYANPLAKNWWWDEQATEFMNGNAAMMMLFADHTSALSEKKHSRISGKYEVVSLPGKSSVLGGWSLGIRKDSECKPEAMEFLKWIGEQDLLEEYVLQGRVPPRFDPVSRQMISSLYNWYNTAVDAFSDVKARQVPDSWKAKHISEITLEQIVGKNVHEAVIGKVSPEQAIQSMRHDLARMA